MDRPDGDSPQDQNAAQKSLKTMEPGRRQKALALALGAIAAIGLALHAIGAGSAVKGLLWFALLTVAALCWRNYRALIARRGSSHQRERAETGE